MEIRRRDIEGLGQILNDRAGLKLQAEGEFGLELALKGRMQALKLHHSSAYLQLVRGPEADSELHRLLPLVTVGKTDFFRDDRQFQAMSERLVVERLELARREHRPLRIWSAGCATGEEPFSLAMVCMEKGVHRSELELRATDINGEAVYEAKRGVYSRRKMKPVSPERTQRFFLPEGDDAVQVSPELRERVQFEVGNLAEEIYNAPPGGYDFVFCRNVMIYFDSTTLIRVLDRMFSVLAPGGYLALGYSESLYRIFNRFQLTEVLGAFLYRRPLGNERPRTPPPIHRPRTPALMPRIVLPPVEAPARTPPVVRSTASTPPPRPATDPGIITRLLRGSPQAPHRLSRAVELIERGQFLEALDLLRALTQAEPDSLVGWITLGNLLSVLRRFPEAFRAYAQALEVEPLSAEARLFWGIAFAESNEMGEARHELMRALFLDGELALAHYYLARAHEASGDAVAARRSYRNCLSICQQGRPAKPYLGHYPDLPKDPEVLGRAAQYALGAMG